MIDSLLFRKRAAQLATLASAGIAADFLHGDAGFGVVTLHRPSNVGTVGNARAISLCAMAVRSR
jgi:hypothetical protein